MKTTCMKAKKLSLKKKTDSDNDKLNDLIGNMHSYCYELERYVSESR